MQKILDRYTVSDYVYDISLAKRELGDDCDPLFLKAIASLEFCLAQGKPFDLDSKFIGFLSSSDIAQEVKLYVTVLLESLYADPQKFNLSIYESLNAIWLQCLSEKVLNWYLEVECWKHILHVVKSTPSVAVVNLGCDMLSFLSTKDKKALQACRELIVAYFVDNENKTTNIALTLLLSLISSFSGRGECLFPTQPFDEVLVVDDAAFAVLGSHIEKNEEEDMDMNEMKLEWTKVIISSIFSLIIDGDAVLQSKLVFVLKSLSNLTFFQVNQNKIQDVEGISPTVYNSDSLKREVCKCCVAMLLMRYTPAGKGIVLRNRNPTQEAVNALVEQLEKQSHHRKEQQATSVHQHVTSYDKYLQYIEQEKMSQIKHKSIYEISRDGQQNASQIGGAIAHHKDIMEVISLKVLFEMLPEQKELLSDMNIHISILYHVLSFLNNIRAVVTHSIADLVIQKDASDRNSDFESDSESDVEGLNEEPYIEWNMLENLMYNMKFKSSANERKVSRRESRVAALQLKMAKVSLMEHLNTGTAVASLSNCVACAESEYIFALSQLVDMQEKQFQKIKNPLNRRNRRKQLPTTIDKLSAGEKSKTKSPRKISDSTPSYLKDTTRSRSMSISKKRSGNSPAVSRRGSALSQSAASRKPSILTNEAELVDAPPVIDENISSLLESSHARVSNMDALDEELQCVHSAFNGVSGHQPSVSSIASRSHTHRHTIKSIHNEHRAHDSKAPSHVLIPDSIIVKPSSIDTTLAGVPRNSGGNSPLSFANMSVSPFAVGSTTHQQMLLKRYMEKQNIPRIIEFYALFTSFRIAVFFLQVYIEINPSNSVAIESILRSHELPLSYMVKGDMKLVDAYTTFRAYLHILMNRNIDTSIDISSATLKTKINECASTVMNSGDLNESVAHFSDYMNLYRDLSQNCKLNDISSCTIEPSVSVNMGTAKEPHVDPTVVAGGSVLRSDGKKLDKRSATNSSKLYKRYQHVSKFSEGGRHDGDCSELNSNLEVSKEDLNAQLNGLNNNSSDCSWTHTSAVSENIDSQYSPRICEEEIEGLDNGFPEKTSFNSKFPMLFKQSTMDAACALVNGSHRIEGQNSLDSGSYTYWPSAASISSSKRAPIPPTRSPKASVASPKVKMLHEPFSSQFAMLAPIGIPNEPMSDTLDSPLAADAVNDKSPQVSRPNTYQRILHELSGVSNDFGNMGLSPRSPPMYGRCGIVDGSHTSSPHSPIRTRGSPKSSPKLSPSQKRNQSPPKEKSGKEDEITKQEVISPTAENWAKYVERVKNHGKRKVFNTAEAFVPHKRLLSTKKNNGSHQNVAEKYARAMLVASTLKEQTYFIRDKTANYGNAMVRHTVLPPRAMGVSSDTTDNHMKNQTALQNPRLYIDPKWISGKSTMPLLVGKQPEETSKI